MSHFKSEMAEQRSGPKFCLVTSVDPLRQRLWQMCQCSQLTDFVIKAGSTEVPCHRNILAAQCDSFNKIFARREANQAEDNITNFTNGCESISQVPKTPDNAIQTPNHSVTFELDGSAVQHVIKYVYTGRIECDVDALQGVVEVLDQLQVNDELLMEKIAACILSCGTLGDERLRERACNMMMKKFNESRKESEFSESNFMQQDGRKEQMHNGEQRQVSATVNQSSVFVSREEEKLQPPPHQTMVHWTSQTSDRDKAVESSAKPSISSTTTSSSSSASSSSSSATSSSSSSATSSSSSSATSSSSSATSSSSLATSSSSSATSSSFSATSSSSSTTTSTSLTATSSTSSSDPNRKAEKQLFINSFRPVVANQVNSVDNSDLRGDADVTSATGSKMWCTEEADETHSNDDDNSDRTHDNDNARTHDNDITNARTHDNDVDKARTHDNGDHNNDKDDASDEIPSTIKPAIGLVSEIKIEKEDQDTDMSNPQQNLQLQRITIAAPELDQNKIEGRNLDPTIVVKTELDPEFGDQQMPSDVIRIGEHVIKIERDPDFEGRIDPEFLDYDIVKSEMNDSDESDTMIDEVDGNDQKVMADVPECETRIQKDTISENQQKDETEVEDTGTTMTARTKTRYSHRKKPTKILETQSKVKIQRGGKRRNVKENSTAGRQKNLRKKYKCQSCGKRFTNTIAYSSEQALACSDCKEFTVQTVKKTRGRKKKKTGRPYDCTVCDKTFDCYGNLLTHQRIHLSVKQFVCDVCGKGFAQKGNLREHYRTHSGEKPFKCPICDRCFTHSSTHKNHVRTHTGEKPYQCELCGKAFRTNTGLRTHSRHDCEGLKYESLADKKRYTCEICDMRFTRPGNLAVHRRVHTNGKTYNCDTCDASFAHSSTLKNHRRLHTGETPYKCVLCFKEFTTNSSLNYHTKKKLCQAKALSDDEDTDTNQNENEGAISCPECGKSFANEKNLQIHKLVHTGEKPFTCEVCDRSFRHVSTFKYHMRTHTKPYECDTCHKGFASESSLAHHQFTFHHKEISSENE